MAKKRVAVVISMLLILMLLKYPKTKDFFVILVVFQDIKHLSVIKTKEQNLVTLANPLHTTIRLVVIKLLMMPNIVIYLRLRKRIFISYLTKVF